MQLFIEHSQSVNNYHVMFQQPDTQEDEGLPRSIIYFCMREGVSPIYARPLFRRRIRIYCTVNAVYTQPRGVHMYVTPHKWMNQFTRFAELYGVPESPVPGFEIWLPKSAFRKFNLEVAVGRRCILQCLPSILCFRGTYAFYIIAYYISYAK